MVRRYGARWIFPVFLAACGGESGGAPSEPEPTTTPARDPRFEKVTLHREFYCEGATFGDFDGDGTTDVALGPDLYRGPDYTERTVLFPRRDPPFDVRAYSDCFFQFTHDFNEDGRLDIFLVGFPGQPGSWFENPGDLSLSWPRHVVIQTVDNEAPAFTDLTGDGTPELVYMTGGQVGYAGPDPLDPAAPWVFHAISEPRGYGAFTHGLGVGDIDGDGRADVMEATGYFLQPPSLDGDPLWTRAEQTFGTPGFGGAQMVTSDLDDDGDADVITTLASHGYGFGWYEQEAPGATPRFTEHIVVPDVVPGDNAEVILHEPHALAFADMDGDGTSDVITGERHWGHPPAEGVPFETPGRLYWFRTETGETPTFEPRLVDDDSGVGTQVTVGDVNGDDFPDIVVANKKGAFVFRQVEAEAP